MAYITSLLNKRVKIYNRQSGSSSSLGYTSGDWVCSGEIWASFTWSRGTKSMREGALDAYDVVMIRARWTQLINRDSRIVIDDKTYDVDTLHVDKMGDTMQLICHEVQI